MKLLIYDPSRAISLYINKSLRDKYCIEICVYLQDLLTKSSFDYDIVLVVVSDKNDLYALIQLMDLTPEMILITEDLNLKNCVRHLDKIKVLNGNDPKNQILSQIEEILNNVNNVVQLRAIL